MIAFMGHGSDELEIPVYDMLNSEFEHNIHCGFRVGTVESVPGIKPVLDYVCQNKPAKVLLTPLLVVAGDHAVNDMAGGENTSWKNILSAEGSEVECLVKGLGEYSEIRRLYTEHAASADILEVKNGK